MSSDNHESQRLAALHRLHILDTAPDPDFDNLTKLARDCLQVPIALVSLIDLERQWFKSKVGLDVDQTPRCISFCTHAVSARQPLIIEDAKADSRFADNPLVLGEPNIRFYAGIPVHDEEGFVLGTFCIIDRQPRMLDDSQLKILKRLAGQAQQLIQLKFASRLLQRERARYQAIVQGAAAGILRIDQSGKILEANDYTLSLLGYRSEDVIGNNVSMLMPERWAQHHDSYVQNYLNSGVGKVIGIGREVEASHHDGHAIPVHLAVSAVKVSGQQEQEFIGILSDLSQVHQARHRERQEKLLLKVLHRGLTDYHALISENQLWVFLQEALCELTGSEYSLIGEVCEGSGSPALKVHAMTDLSWSAESQALMQQFVNGDMTLTDPNTMLGRVFAGGEIVLSNQMTVDERGGHLPHGHPVLHRYLGMPITDRGQVIGMFAIANAEQDYSEEIVRWLQPFNSTCALLINLYRQLNHQQRMAQQLQDARDQAESANRAKTEFLSSMSHELRTPLNSILGFAQLLYGSNPELTDRQQRQAGQIISSGRHLLNLINEVLDLARIESGNMQVSLEPIALDEVMDEVIEIMMPIAHQYHIQLESVDDMNRWSVIADFTRIKQVVLNLLNNAVKYNREYGKVWMSFEELPDHKLRIKVHDTGMGIAKEKISQLFQPFNRLGAESSAIEGTGVGLALTKKLVELMSGKMGVESTPSEGSCFWFELPLSVNVQEKPSWHSQRVVIDETAGADFYVLYVEDNPANQRLMQEVFDGIPHCHLTMECSAESGLEYAFANPPDLILMDIDLSGMNGFEAQQILQDHPKTRDVPVFAITAGASSSQRLRAFEQGFRMFITKPFDVNDLIRNVLTLRNELKGK